MAKITHKGMWIDIKSLEGVDKRNYIICLIASCIAGGLAGFFSVTTSEQGLEIFANVKGNSAYITYAIAQIFFIYVATYTYISVLKNQDQLFQKYNEMSMIGGAVGFILIGIPMAILSPFFGYDVGFIELFFGFAVGSVINGYRFYKTYIKED